MGAGRALLAALGLLGAGQLAAEEAVDRREVDLAVNTPVVQQEKALLLAALRKVRPSKEQAITAPTNGPYVLAGDLFGDGRVLALATLSSSQPEDGSGAEVNLGLAERVADKWEVRRLWRISPIWAPLDPLEDVDQFPHVRPAQEPFYLEDLDGDGRVEVIAAGGTRPEEQDYYTMKLEQGLPRVVAKTVGAPQPVAPTAK